jgi:hypothetical protein
MQLPEALRKEIVPKNILMIGPTGVGKTEIARRLASLAEAPFIKVWAGFRPPHVQLNALDIRKRPLLGRIYYSSRREPLWVLGVHVADSSLFARPKTGTRVACTVFQVEATKFTEVGFHGRDVDSIIRYGPCLSAERRSPKVGVGWGGCLFSCTHYRALQVPSSVWAMLLGL